MKTFVLTPAGWRPGGGTRRSGSHRQSDLQPHVDVAAHASSDAPQPYGTARSASGREGDRAAWDGWHW